VIDSIDLVDDRFLLSGSTSLCCFVTLPSFSPNDSCDAGRLGTTGEPSFRPTRDKTNLLYTSSGRVCLGSPNCRSPSKKSSVYEIGRSPDVRGCPIHS